MTREEVAVLTKQSEEMLDRAFKNFMEALLTNVRLQVQRDLMFIETGDKAILRG